jgi:hypothetical protein
VSVVAKDKGGSGNFPPLPTGLMPALCVDIVDLGILETPFLDERTGQKQKKHQIQVVWQLHEEDEDGNTILRNDGKPFTMAKFYTLSLNEKANLRKDLDSWRGVPFTDEELEEGFDVERLLGVSCKLNLVAYKNAKGEDRVKVSAVAKPSKRDPQVTLDPDFVREKDTPGGRDVRSPKAGKAPKPPVEDRDEEEDEDDDLPF